MALAGRTQQVGTPDEQVARAVFRRFRIFTGERQGAILHGLGHVVGDFHTSLLGFCGNSQRVAVELRRRRQPAHALGTHVVVDQAATEFGLVRQRRQDFVHTQFLVAPLPGVGVEERGGVHVAWRALPVQAKRQRLPAGLRAQFFLANIVGPATTALTDIATHDQHVDQATVVHVHVVPVVHTGTHDDHGTALGLVGVIGELTGNTDHFLGGYAGDFFLPGRGIGLHFIVGGSAVILAQTTADTVVSHHQVVNSDHTAFGAVSQLDLTGAQLVLEDVFDFHVLEVVVLNTTEVRESNIHNVVVLLDHGQLKVDIGALGGLLEVPLALLAPAIADGAIRCGQLASAFVNGDGFPFRVVLFTQAVHQIAGPQEAARHIAAVVFFLQHDQVRHVGVTTHVVGEVLAGFVDVEFFQDDVAHGHAQGSVCALLRVQPLVRQLGHFRIVRSNRNGLGVFVAYFGEEVGVRGTGLGHVGTPGNDVAGVVPVRRFRHVGLLTPGLWGGRRQVAVPVVEAHAHATDHRQVTAAGGVGHHGHGKNRREADDTVRAELLGGVNVGGSNQLVDFVPVGTNETTHTTAGLVLGGFLGVFNNRRPGLHRVVELNTGRTPELHQALAHQRVLQAVGAVHVPGIACTPGAAAGLVVWQVRAGTGIVGLLGFPGDQAVLDVDLPAAGAGAVYAVSGTHHLVVLPALAVAVFPLAADFVGFAVAVGERLSVLPEVIQFVDQMTHGLSLHQPVCRIASPI